MLRGALLVILTACSLEPLDLAQRPCPCAPGWVCSGDDGGVCMIEGPPAPTCADYPGAVICDGFEGGIGDGWDDNFNGASSDERAHSGERSLLFETALGGMNSHRLTLDATNLSGPIFVQAQIQIDEFEEGEDVAAVFQILGGGERIDTFLDGRRRVAVRSGDAETSSGSPLALDAWACVRLELTPEDGGTRVRLYIDDIAVGSTLRAPSFSDGSLFVGPGFANSASRIRVFYDTLVVHRSSIHCGL